MIKLSAQSRAYLSLSVSARRGGVPLTLTADPVAFAFRENPGEADWVDGTWVTVGADTYARVLIGPGAAVLPTGLVPVLVRVTDNPERPVHRAGYVSVY